MITDPRPRRLLILACSATKRHDPDRIPAIVSMGCVSADARTVEINGPIGRMRQQLRLWLLAGNRDREGAVQR